MQHQGTINRDPAMFTPSVSGCDSGSSVDKKTQNILDAMKSKYTGLPVLSELDDTWLGMNREPEFVKLLEDWELGVSSFTFKI